MSRISNTYTNMSSAAASDQESKKATSAFDCDELRLQLQRERDLSSQLQQSLKDSERNCDRLAKLLRDRDTVQRPITEMTEQEREWEGLLLLAIECQRAGRTFRLSGSTSTSPTPEQLARLMQVCPDFQYNGRLAGPRYSEENCILA